MQHTYACFIYFFLLRSFCGYVFVCKLFMLYAHLCDHWTCFCAHGEARRECLVFITLHYLLWDMFSWWNQCLQFSLSFSVCQFHWSSVSLSLCAEVADMWGTSLSFYIDAGVWMPVLILAHKVPFISEPFPKPLSFVMYLLCELRNKKLPIKLKPGLCPMESHAVYTNTIHIKYFLNNIRISIKLLWMFLWAYKNFCRQYS